MQYRNQNVDNYTPNADIKSLNFEYLPWTAANGKDGVADALQLQVKISKSYLF